MIGEGEIHFWKERWFEGIRFGDVAVPPNDCKTMTVREGIMNEGGKLDR